MVIEIQSGATPLGSGPWKQRLRPYQVEAGRAILDSVLRRRGLSFSVEVARQGGKNELSAQLEALLLTLHLGQYQPGRIRLPEVWQWNFHLMQLPRS